MPEFASIAEALAIESQKPEKEQRKLIAIEGRILDITSFAKSHPGGKELLLDHVGSDASEDFKEGHEHSEAAWGTLDELEVGTIKGFERTVDTKFGVDSHGNKVRLDSVIDVNKPLVWQVLTSSEPALYHDWLETAHTLRNDLKLFQTPELEAVSGWSWKVIFLWVPISIVFFFRGWAACGSLFSAAMAFCSGMLSWSLLEYVLHRWVFHMMTTSPAGNIVHFFAHGIHHLTPLDKSRLVFPPPFAAFLASCVYLLGTLIADPKTTAYHAWFSGLAAMYMAYDIFHYNFHHGSLFDQWGYLRRMKHRHMRHHYHNANANYGVTSAFWDYVFGTVDDEQSIPKGALVAPALDTAKKVL